MSDMLDRLERATNAMTAQRDEWKMRAEKVAEALKQRDWELAESGALVMSHEGHIAKLEAEVARMERHMDALFNAGDRVCGEAMQMTVSVPRKQAEQADRLEDAVNKFRGACLNRAALADEKDNP